MNKTYDVFVEHFFYMNKAAERDFGERIQPVVFVTAKVLSNYDFDYKYNYKILFVFSGISEVLQDV